MKLAAKGGECFEQRPASTPFLRWPGAKNVFFSRLVSCVPHNFGRYFEPFLGGGALFFGLSPEGAIVGDKISRLISTYRAVRDGPTAVFNHLIQWNVDRETYYGIRAESEGDRFQRAARFIYLNKTCWNGIYRVNSSGGFNVPYGKPKSTYITDIDRLISCSKVLRSTTSILNADFEETLEGCKKGDFVYLDPPYVTGHSTNGFVDYNERLFSWEDQRRLARVVEGLVTKGAKVILTNADHASVRDLYDGFNMVSVSRHSTLAGSASHRRRVTELLISNLKVGNQ